MKIIQKYFKDLSPLQVDRFSRLSEIYQYWNNRINVISRKDIEHLYIHHVLHSLAIAKVISFPEGTKVLDVGTGGGFPGIPLAILFPMTNFFLIDGTGKKIKVVNEVKNALELDNVTAKHIRAENLKLRFNFIVSRAVTTLPEFYQLVKKNFTQPYNKKQKEGIYYLKGGDVSDEMAGFKGKAKETSVSGFFTEPFFDTKKVIFIPFR
jgi:16S rRNA (guanine527-N7)-methyltransferase